MGQEGSRGNTRLQSHFQELLYFIFIYNHAYTYVHGLCFGFYACVYIHTRVHMYRMQGASHQLSHSLSLGKLHLRAGRTSEGWLPWCHLLLSAPRHRSVVGGGPNVRRSAVRHKDTLPGSQFLRCRGKMSKEISLQTGSSQEKMIGTGSSAFRAVFGGKAGGTEEVPFQRIMRLDPVFPKLHLHEPSRGRGAWHRAPACDWRDAALPVYRIKLRRFLDQLNV